MIFLNLFTFEPCLVSYICPEVQLDVRLAVVTDLMCGWQWLLT